MRWKLTTKKKGNVRKFLVNGKVAVEVKYAKWKPQYIGSEPEDAAFIVAPRYGIREAEVICRSDLEMLQPEAVVVKLMDFGLPRYLSFAVGKFLYKDLHAEHALEHWLAGALAAASSQHEARSSRARKMDDTFLSKVVVRPRKVKDKWLVYWRVKRWLKDPTALDIMGIDAHKSSKRRR